jgi:LuxR family transcriptional regulator, quorum-sensing system regulator SdiA
MAASATGLVTVSRFTAGLERANGFEECLDVLYEAVASCGWSKVVYGWARCETPEDSSEVPLMFRGFPEKWDKRIRNWSKYSAHDPYFTTAVVSQSAVSWRDVRAKSARLTQMQRDCISYAEDLGMVDGLTIPIHVPGRRFAFVTALECRGRANAVDERNFAALMTLIAHYFDNRVLDTARDWRNKSVRISRREHQCLQWSARGKTIDEIGEILDLSAETVRVYMKRINQKLQACNRTHAVAKALHLGIVQLN